MVAKVGQKGTRFLLVVVGWLVVGWLVGWRSGREEWCDLTSKKSLFAISFLRFEAHAETYYVCAKVGQKRTRFLFGGGGWLVGWLEWCDLSSKKPLFAIIFLRFEAHLNGALCGGNF